MGNGNNPQDSQADAVASAGSSKGSTAVPASSTDEAAPVASVVYDNRRCNPTGAENSSAGGNLLTEALAQRDRESGIEASGDAANVDGQSAPPLWQLRWLANPDQVHGPFDSVTMHGWMTQGCFSEERPAEVRQCDSSNNAQESCWHKCEKVDFELYL